MHEEKNFNHPLRLRKRRKRRKNMNRIFIIALIALFAALPDSSRGASGTFSGYIWNDINRDGIQDVDEPPMSNFPIVVYNESHLVAGCEVVFTNYTDSNGNYEFTHSKTSNVCNYPPIYSNNNFAISYNLDGALVVSTSGVFNIVGADPRYLPYGFLNVSNENVVATNVNFGLSYWNVGVSLDVLINDLTYTNPVYVTNGTPLTITYRVTNTAEVFLSQIDVLDEYFTSFLGSLNCPATLPPGGSHDFGFAFVITESITSTGIVIALPVTPSSCNLFGYPRIIYNPDYDTSPYTIIVVTNLFDHVDGDVFPNWWEMQYGFDPLNSNAPNVNSDSDWMSNYEEFIAGTNPTNGASYFSNAGLTEDYLLLVTPSITNRVYNIWRSTNLLGEPQEWSLYPPEQTGTGSAVLFTIPVDEPAAQFRTGVRLP